MRWERNQGQDTINNSDFPIRHVYLSELQAQGKSIVRICDAKC